MTRSRARSASPVDTSRRKPRSSSGSSAPGMVVVDVGANWGYFTLVCANLVGATGIVIALEPHPRLASMLSANIAGHLGLSEFVDVYRVAAGAASESTGVCRLRRARWQLGRVACRRGTGGSGLRVADRRASMRFSMTARQKRVDLVKIDIEGAEAEAIRGMATGIAQHRYRYVLLECHPAELARMGASVEAVPGAVPPRGLSRLAHRSLRRDAPPRGAPRGADGRTARADRRPHARVGSVATSSCGRLPARPCRRECVSRTSACRTSSAAPRSSCSR